MAETKRTREHGNNRALKSVNDVYPWPQSHRKTLNCVEQGMLQEGMMFTVGTSITVRIALAVVWRTDWKETGVCLYPNDQRKMCLQYQKVF